MATPASLLKLIEDGVIDRVLSPLKSGKEADMYVVAKDDVAYAAKVYKKREQRSFRNNAAYRDGRSVRNTRSARAMEKGTRFGKQVAEDAWQKAEAEALRSLHSAGVRVPQVYAHHEGVLVMELIVDALGRPAPQLAQVKPTAAEADALYDQLLGQVVLMLMNDVVHGDFSPYNVLVSAEGPVVIDLPQVVSASHNLKACVLVERDVQSVARYLGIYSPTVRRLSREAWQIWHQHEKGTLVPEFRPAPPPEPPPPDPAVVAAQRALADAGPGEVMDLVREARRERDGPRGRGRGGRGRGEEARRDEPPAGRPRPAA
ncbi:MAG: serine protein kinase RIO [Planctomycetes bacterium]|nr:serine protein kinase RIO [Planctomycetota bacterium]